MPLAARITGFFASDEALRRRIANVGQLLTGNVASGILAMVGVAIAMRTLGPAQYGILALVISFGRLVERFTRFESWQPLIKYAVTIEGENQREELRRLYAFGLRLDVAACAAAALLSSGIATFAGSVFGLEASHVSLVLIYSVALALNITGLPTAVLRLAGKFRTIAYAQVFPNALRVVICLWGLYEGKGIAFFAWAWAGTQIAGSLLFLFLAWRELRKQQLGNLVTASCVGITERFPGIAGFAVSSNLSMTIRSSANDLDVLMVGWLADPTAAGIYYFVKRFAKMVQQIAAQVQAVLYPDIARMWALQSYGDFLRAVRQVHAVLATFAVVSFLALAIAGRWLIHIGPGDSYLSAQPQLLVQIVAIGLTMHAAPSRAALLAMGRQASVLNIVLVATLLFHAVLLSLVPVIGPMGANIAHVVLALCCAVAMDFALYRGVAAARSGAVA